MKRYRLNTITNPLARIAASIRSQDEEGQTLVEYGLIVALLSIAAIVILGLLGSEVVDVFNSVKNALAGATP
jgi:pilus assembly protein Flp/PilA